MADLGDARPQAAAEVRPEEHYIEADRSLVERPLRTLKHGDLFGMFDITGDLGRSGKGPEGLFFHDTRFLSRLDLTLCGEHPLLLDSVVLTDNSALLVDLSNTDLHDEMGEIALSRGNILANRWKFLRGQHCFERIALRSFSEIRHELTLAIAFDADFADLFEIRGEHRLRRGSLARRTLSGQDVEIAYTGLDGLLRRTRLHFHPPPSRIGEGYAEWRLALEPGERAGTSVTIGCSVGEEPFPERPTLAAAYRDVRRTTRPQRNALARVTSSNPLFNEVLSRAAFDLEMLLTETGSGPYPYAGIPWYSTIFGRDGIITAMQVLPFAPSVARGVLRTLASLQASEVDEAADAQPGKILHESRAGEMARTGEVPFRRYYGTIDATPLFVMLAGSYHRRTGDAATIRDIWPNIEAAVDWIDAYGDCDGDGFVEYHRMTDQGLANQGWKDSHDSIFHADGALAEGPIALCEVQGYAYAAKLAAAELASVLGRQDRARRWADGAEALRAAFEERFWLDDLQTYALALDGGKRPCRVRASNAGHALFCGIASAERAAAVARLLLGPRFFSGWGVRTIAAKESRYNPISYHNGSVWPHDNALIAMGLVRYGFRREAVRILDGLFAAAAFDELRRLPELFCGFERRFGRGPVAYPVACSPQAWAAAAPFALLCACIGLDVDHANDCIRVVSPRLPDFLDWLLLPDLRLGDSRMSIRLQRSGDEVTAVVAAREGSARLIVLN